MPKTRAKPIVAARVAAPAWGGDIGDMILDIYLANCAFLIFWGIWGKFIFWGFWLGNDTVFQKRP